MSTNIAYNSECVITSNYLETTIATTCQGTNPCCVPASSTKGGTFAGDGTKGICIPQGCPTGTPVLATSSSSATAYKNGSLYYTLVACNGTL